MGDGRNVQNGVCGAAQRHIDGNGVFEGGLRRDVAGFDAFFEQIQYFHARLLGQAMPRGKHCRNRAVPGQPEPQRFRDAVHRIGRVHAGAGPAAGAGAVFQLLQLGGGHLFGLHRAYAFKYRDEINGFVLDLSRKHRSAADKNGREVEPQRRHQHAGNNLITVGNEHQRVERMGHCHDFNGIGDQLPAGQRIFHAGMVHGDAVTDADDGKFNGGSTGHADARFYILGD